MVNYQRNRLNATFAALADPTRRAVLARLASGGAAAGELAQPFAMSLPGFMKHLGILERAGLLTRRKRGRVVHCALTPQALKEPAEWLDRYRQFWDNQLDSLERFLDEKDQEPWPPHRPKQPRRSPSFASSRRRRKRSTRPGPSRRR